MITIYRSVNLLITLLIFITVHAQTLVKGRVIDANTGEPIAGASISCTDPGCQCGCLTNSIGEFEMKCTKAQSLSVSFIGYQSMTVAIDKASMVILQPSSSLLNEVIVTANRGEAVKRSLAPIAVSTITSATIQDNKPVSADHLLNKVSGVNMVSLGNEQHQMSIRQPITTKSLFLYLEDGIPVRTTGIFNHNALLEMNMAATKNIEVIKGPSSSLYGSEAIGGVVNFITVSPTINPHAKITFQGNDLGYKRAEWQSSVSKNKWGFALSGFHAAKTNGYMEYSDFHKSAITARLDYTFSDKTQLTNSATWIKYYSEMPGSIDSTMFATRKFTNLHSFTYRKVDALRFRSTLSHAWNNFSKTSASLVLRDNTIGQNPAYRVKDDYRRVGNNWVGKKDLAHGEINTNDFRSIAFIAQHRQSFAWKNTNIVAGTSIDLSPSSYNAKYIRIKKDSITRKYLSYQATDSLLTGYETQLNNYAAFGSLEFSPVEKLRVVVSLRYDLFRYNFDNHLEPSSFSGSADTVNSFRKISPKIGFTYNFSSKTGIYANYSQGFVPPQVTEMYTGVKVPDLRPSIFNNYEIGGWAEIIKNKLSMEASIYQLDGSNEVVSVKLDDGSTENRNAGKTSHRGIEFGMNIIPVKNISIRMSGAYSEHRFVDFIEKGSNYSGNEMNGAPRWIHNAEIWYKPAFAKGLRLGVEWQKVGPYFMDPKNTARYNGYDLLNIRAGYRYKAFDIWMNVLNATNSYYSNLSTKTAYGQSYQLAEPRSFNLGLSYNLADLFTNKR